MATALTRDTRAIPNHLHFIWFGKTLPDFAQIAISSALEQNPGATATLWHDGLLGRNLWQLTARGAKVAKIVPSELFAELRRKRPEVPASEIEALYATLEKPAARANVIRMVVLFLYGGIYLDTDTLCVKTLAPLRELGAFCGEEPTLWPAGTSLLDPRALLLGELRRACSFLPHGYRLHAKMLPRYTMAANNAVLGARAGHPFMGEMLRQAAELPANEAKRRYRLGTHLLQKTLRIFETTARAPQDRMIVLGARYFYPLGPEISRHYFHSYADPRAVTGELLSDETYVIHWYASVADLLSRDSHYIRKTAHQTVYSSLCRPHVADRALSPVATNVASSSLA